MQARKKPHVINRAVRVKYGVRTHDLQGHNLAL